MIDNTKQMTREEMLALVELVRMRIEYLPECTVDATFLVSWVADLASAVETMDRALMHADEGDCFRTQQDPQRCPDPKPRTCLDCYVAQAAADLTAEGRKRK